MLIAWTLVSSAVTVPSLQISRAKVQRKSPLAKLCCWCSVFKVSHLIGFSCSFSCMPWIFFINICQCQALKWLFRALLKLCWFERALQRPVWESCGKGRLRDPAFLVHPLALMETWVLAELQPHTHSSTRPFESRLVFPVQWFHSCHAKQQTWWYVGGIPAYPFKSLNTVQRRWLQKSICTQQKHDVFSKFCEAMSAVQGINE